jgi:8-oxo-dGTP diphosphatase
VIEAAGGVVWRRTASGSVEVLLVHRPRYDDWSLPKGKLEDGEAAPDAALREVEEETGLRCKLGAELDEVRYQDRMGRDKRVRYWAMEPVAGRFAPTHEVDEVRWVRLDDAPRQLTYGHDAGVISGFRSLVSA